MRRHTVSCALLRLAPFTLTSCSLAVSLDPLDREPLVSADAGANDGAEVATSPPADASVAPGADAATSTATLIAYYPFDETGGTFAFDQSGHGRTATLFGGATFSPGFVNHAATLNGNGQYVSVPVGLMTGLTSFSISAWIYLASAPTWTRIFDFGTGTNAYMMLTPMSDTKTLRFAITLGGDMAEQRIDAAGLPTGRWEHVALTFANHTGILYVNGLVAAKNTSMTLTPASLGTTTQTWVGRSQFGVDPYLNGKIDELRVYSGALTAAEVSAQANGS